MNKRRSRWVPSGPKCWISSPEADLLHRDFNTHVVPYRQNTETYQLTVEGASYHQVLEALSPGGRGQRLDGLLRGIASKLLTDHEVWLEIAFNDEDQESVAFGVFEVDGVKRTAEGSLMQVPPDPARLPDWFRDNAEWEHAIQLDEARMVYISLPKEYPSELLRQVVRDLAESDIEILLSWVQSQLRGERADAPQFDVRETTRTQRLRIAQVSLPIGWTARERYYRSTVELSDYYYYLRELKFLHFRSSLRSCVEKGLSQVLALASKRCDFVASVTTQGTHTPQEVRELIRKFEEGDLPFSDLNSIIFEDGSSRYSPQRCVV